jgi:zinc transport system permease protein
MELLDYDFMRRALVAALLVGLAAPAVGIYLVQRRLTLIGDGLGHVAVAGVALGLVLQGTPLLVAALVTVGAAVAMELIRIKGRTSGEIALALLFYGGIAGGVVLVSRAPAGQRNLDAYLFGAITTTSTADLVTFAILAAVVLGLALGLGRELFAISNDEEQAQAAGLPVVALNLLLVVLTALTVVVSMRIVGVLLISALMVVPVATAQLVAPSFRITLVIAILIGVVVSVTGVVTSYYADTPSGGTIVVLAIALFLVVALGLGAMAWGRQRAAARAPTPPPSSAPSPAPAPVPIDSENQW